MKLLLPLLALCLISTQLRAEETFSKQLPVEATAKIEIFNSLGEVIISSWDRPELAVDARMESGVDRIGVTTETGVANIRVLLKSPTSLPTHAQITVRVPSTCDVEVVTVSASIVVHGSPKVLSVRSISGRIDVEGSDRMTKTRLETLSGAVAIHNGKGDVEVEAATGAINVAMEQASRIQVRAAAGGHVELNARLNPAAQVDVSSTGGAIQARLLAESGYLFDVSTFGGRFTTCFNTGSSNGTGQVGAGKANVRLESFGGAVTLCDH